ncbi:hypothetical protein [Nocardia coubleae]|uniref:Uncharacterized protein n=1 Tax=Nocardia coubleae TaxID=356147 RepID=A0A846W579_9NOCA|nr:hypothetical protein [Nocardia coubleae]NKX88003.1 hypothetical protein [Nocardia coubleae]
MNLGDDRLPTSVTLHKQLARVAEPSEYGKLIIDAYNHSLYAKDLEKAENGQSIRTMPKLREITAALLQTRRYTDYIELYNDFLGSREHTVGGPGQTRWGEPSVVIRASTARLFDVRIDPEWASRNSMLTIADDIIACCNTIRARQPTIVHDQYLSQETDDEVISRLIKHCQQLLRNEI